MAESYKYREGVLSWEQYEFIRKTDELRRKKIKEMLTEQGKAALDFYELQLKEDQEAWVELKEIMYPSENRESVN